MRWPVAVGAVISLAVGSLIAGGTSAGRSGRALSTGCPARVDASAFADAGELERLNARIAGFGLRTTASPAHDRLLRWLEGRLKRIPGMSVRSDSYVIRRWQPTPKAATGPGRDLGEAGRLAVLNGGRASVRVATAGAVPYSRPTGAAGRTGRLKYLPRDRSITAANARGRIVIRDVPDTPIPNARSGPPRKTRAAEGSGRPYTANFGPDLLAAGRAGAAGVVFAWDVPAGQVRGYFDPHQGTHWAVPAVWAGVDEAVLLKRMAARGRTARITVLAEADDASTRNLIATLPGRGGERIVVNTNTDGNTWVQENGNAAVLALARYLAALPARCRPRTYEFVFSTAHLHMSKEGAERHARRLDSRYDSGSVAFVFAVEHLGTREILPVDRTDGPGRRLVFTGRGEPYGWFAGESRVLAQALKKAVDARGVPQTMVLPGLDPPDASRVPVHCSFGGLGTAYQRRLIPTLAGVSGPWSLWAPSFGRRAIDFHRMHAQTLTVGDTLLALDDLPRAALAGEYPAERARRAAGNPTCPAETYPEQAPMR
ncbi:hypothetical protein [Thermomonospora umbrina]|uniref:PA domain-containing protein n=1 Tax=Thermomonospora umbrina TaxID=111806 RepID=A0A3D9SH40_9ACTN|nr:hypothetical protein [Thermomonospora umbrina]REE95216.1 hypothetical protein DFJ69_0599 [Thermomonospora umbrina]